MSVQAAPAPAPERKRRPRRIAADEAHAWARNLRLGNPYAKLVLCMLTLYVDGDGRCFVSVQQLAEDCEFAVETVRRRLAWLEGLGAIARLAQWVDEHGRRNSEGRGRRTSDEIRLLVEADPESIEALAVGDDPQSDPPLGDGGQIDGQESVDPPASPLPTPSLRPGPDSLNPEQEEPPNPPSGGGRVVDEDLEKHIDQFCTAYPAPITNMPRLRIVLTAMTVDERRRVITAVKGYASYIAECEKRGKPRAVKDADRWVAAGMWQGYLSSGVNAETAALVTHVEVDSIAGRALVVLHKIARISEPRAFNGKFLIQRPLTDQVLALANAPPVEDWLFIEIAERHQCGAWNELVHNALPGIARPELARDKGIGENLRRGILVPWPWPPRKDGMLSTTGPPDHSLSDEDVKSFTGTGK